MTRLATRLLEQDDVRWIRTEGSVLVPAERVLVVAVAIYLKSQGGQSKNWRAGWGISKRVRTKVMHVLARIDLESVVRFFEGYPNKLTFTRLAPRSLDSDNLATVMKPVRDQTCAWLCGKNAADTVANDGIRSGYEFAYRQQRQSAYGVQIQLERV